MESKKISKDTNINRVEKHRKKGLNLIKQYTTSTPSTSETSSSSLGKRKSPHTRKLVHGEL